MGNANSNEYDRNETILNLDKEEINWMLFGMIPFRFWRMYPCGSGNMIGEHTEKLKDMNLKEEKFSNINLDEYRNSDGTFNSYKVKRPLNCRSWNELYRVSSKLFHQGVGIGKEEKIIFFRLWHLERKFWLGRYWKSRNIKCFKWRNKGYIFFGKNSEKWVNHNDYNLSFA